MADDDFSKYDETPTAPAPAPPPSLAKNTKGQAYGVASMGFSVLGGILKGMADMQAGNANAATSRGNAGLADRAATDAALRGQAAAAYALLKGGDLAGKQKSAYAGAGVAVGVGSASDVVADTKGISSLDAKIIQNNAAREAWGMQTQAANLRHKASIEEVTGRQQAEGDILKGITGAASYGAQMTEMS